MTFYLAFHLACLLTFFPAFFLAFYLEYLLTFYLAYLLAFYLAHLLTFYLDLSGILFGILYGFVLAVGVWLKSGEAHGA